MLCVMQLERVNWENRTLKQQLQYADPVLLLLSGPTLLCISLVSCPKKHAETINRQTVCFLLVADPDEGPSRTATKRASIGHVRSTVANLLLKYRGLPSCTYGNPSGVSRIHHPKHNTKDLGGNLHRIRAGLASAEFQSPGAFTCEFTLWGLGKNLQANT